MIIPTITTYLYEVHRDREWLKAKAKYQRKAAILLLSIFTALSLAVYLWIFS